MPPNLYLLGFDVIREATKRLPASGTLPELFGVLNQCARFLLPTAQIGLLLRQPDACFELVDASPFSAKESLSKLTDTLIDSGCFARALQQGSCRALDLPDRTCLLQSIATSKRIYGMVVWVDTLIPPLLHQPLGALVDLSAASLERLQTNAASLPAPLHRDQSQSGGANLIEEIAIAADQLTGLAHRSYFIHFMQRACRARTAQTAVGTILLDIDGFHRVNREYGCETGDRVLRDVALRLDSALRSQSIYDTMGIAECDLCFARTGADEFGLAVAHMRHPDRLPEIAAYLHRHLSEGFRQEDSRLYLSVSIGVASSIADPGPVSAQSLLRNADTALKRAKLEGRNQLAVYQSGWDEAGSPHLRIESLLQEALRKDWFALHFQPILRLDDLAPIGAEVLLRLRMGDGVPLPPSNFIPIAESTGLIVEIGEWVLRRVCRQIHVWEARGFPVIPLAINVSGIELSQANLTERFTHILEQERIPVTRLHIEITETAIARNEVQALANIQALRAAGFEVWIDDFGTGYSSLKSVKNLPVSGLKLDREFVKDLVRDPAADVIASSILTMARHLGYAVIGEGIESAAQLRFLKQQGCELGQGFHLGRPVGADAFQARYFRKEAGRTQKKPL